ncbi:MAG: hypothetical protein M3268_02430 [Acidobacteriota bacterium]|nr:hypothetical protein [Acidobacteriota bacterium]
MSAEVQSSGPDLRRWQTPLVAVGVVCLALCAVGWLLSPDQFFRSYLMAFVFWAGLTLGCLGVLMMQYVTGGAWGIILRRTLESATRTIPLVLVFFLPLLLGLHRLYVWTNSAVVEADPLLQHKRPFLNVPFFLARAAVYFVCWLALIFFLNRWSRRQDATGEPRLAWRLEHLSAPGLFLLSVTISLALIDWVMSLEPRWYSTIYAVGFMAGEMLAAFAFSIAVVILLSSSPPLEGVVKPKHFRALGNLMLTFVMLWAYCAFSQYLLIWSGNLRAEIPWYLRRITGGWGWIAIALIVFHFFLPFFLLLFREIKDHRRTLVTVAAVVILLRFVDLFWLVEPAFYRDRFSLHWLDFAALFGLGAIWLAVFAWQLRARPLLPLRDPYAEEAFADE